MTVLSYQTIKTFCTVNKMLDPWAERTILNGKTYGLSSAGYDIRVAEDHVLRPGGFELGSSLERFKMPHSVIAFVHDKSSWARKGLAVQNTVIEPGWEGYLTIELTNHLPMQLALDLAPDENTNSIHIKAGDAIAQIVFHFLDNPTVMPYKGKYQNQEASPQPAREEK